MITTDFSSCKTQKQKHQVTHPILTFIINIFAVCGILFSLAFFSIYRKIVDFYLKIKIGKCYGGIMAPEDVIFFASPVSKCCITSVFYIECGKNTNVFERVCEIVKEKVIDYPDKYPKLTSTVHKSCGYFYTKTEQCDIFDLVRPIKLETGQTFNDEYLKKYTGDLANAEFGKNDTMLWEILVAPNPIVGDFHKPYTYPIIARFHHSVADGTTLISLLLQIWGDESCENYCRNIFKKFKDPLTNPKTYNSWTEMAIDRLKNLINLVLLYLEMIFISFGKVIEMVLFKPNNINALHGRKITGEKICAWTIEDKTECIQLAKNIKNREKTNFNTVIATAMAASLSQYFKRNGFPIPEYITGALTFLTSYPDEDSSKPVVLNNKSGVIMFDLPMIYGSKTLQQALQHVFKEWNRQLKVSHGLIFTFLMHHIACIPLQILTKCFSWKSQTFLLSNVPGGSVMKTQDGWTCHNIIPIAPNAQEIGVSFGILTYDDKFHIGVLVDKAFVSSQEEVQKIADDVLFYIKLLDNETQ
ncbi:uncharacterized protein LOC126746203 [Anthonomus grandis grandis]|uniref:uncharacterized protein LOC126746203 n=1 Tax=Anthonomus grandis grandis TaxID=2921223 RepID=UPI0021665641|nr:uncharacterized protein LOC126746203 [Anthonomus grandis grandis]